MKTLAVEVTPGFEKSLLQNAHRLGFEWMFADKDYCPGSKYFYFDNKIGLGNGLCISHSNSFNPDYDYLTLKYPDQLHDVIGYLSNMAGLGELGEIIANIRREING